jgi:Domain of unknown function (DUF4129)
VSAVQETPAGAREEARRILAEDRFHETELPRPLRRPLEWLGDRLEPIVEFFERLLEPLPGETSLVWLVLAAVALLFAVLAATQLVRRHGPAAPGRRGGSRAAEEESADAATLERLAEAAEQAGELERALRLRFRAGILRLVERRQLDDPDVVTTGSLMRTHRSELFSAGARAFEEVVYGRRAPTPEDVRRVRDGWQAVLAR